MSNRLIIQPMGLFATPDSMESLTRQLEDLGPSAMLGAGLAWNYLVSVLKEHHEKQTVGGTNHQNPYANAPEK